MNPKISIITVVRNAGPALRRTLRGLSSLTYPNVELIVIDGGSTDSTGGVIAEYAHSITYWVSEPDAGLYDAMNKGLRAATGEYVWFVNAGDLPYSSDVLTHAIPPSEHYADVYYGEAMIVDSNGVELGLRRKRLPSRLTWRNMRRGMVVCHQAFIARRDLCGEYDVRYRYVADIAWVIDILKRSRDIRNTHRVLCKFELGGVSTVRRRASLRERFSLMRRYFGLIPTIWAHARFILDAVFSSGYRSIKP